MRWAIVNLDTNIVENVIIWDGIGDLPFPVDTIIQLVEDERCGPGFAYNANNTPRFTEVE
jgi:hypothetical protein